MKHLRRAAIFVAVLIGVFVSAIILFISVCVVCRIVSFVELDWMNPGEQPGSTWSTPDGEIYFTVEEEVEKRFKAPMLENIEPWQYSVMETQMYGEINIAGIKYIFFIDSFAIPGQAHMTFYSDEMPTTAEDGQLFGDFVRQYELCSFDIDYKSTKHFKAIVDQSNIPDIKEGTVFHFYRTQKGAD